jgi:tetratricopeptide (TPR) repeat protein
MKVASVYRVPVPKEALFLDPSASYDSIVELTELALLRPIGEAEYDVHDSIREFFEELLSESERREIGGFAAQRLEAVAESARDRGDRMASIQALSNAVRLSGERPEHPRLLEELGDALESIGDLPDALAAYRESLGRSTSVDDRARLHRKAASAFEERADIPSARAEIDAGLEALGDAVLPERGWLLAIRCAVTRYADEYEEAREYGREALRVFRECRDPRGEVRALLELGWTDLVSPTGDSEAAEPLLTEAFTKGESVGDSQLLGNVRIALSQMYGYSGRPDEGLKHLAALEDVPILHIRRSALEMKGWLLVNFRGDFDGAEAAFRESGDLARQMFDPVTMTIAKYGRAIVRYYQGQMKEAQAAFREVAREFQSEGIPGFIDEVQDLAARTALIEGSVETFRRDAAALAGHDSSHGAEVRSSIVLTTRGLICLLDGDETGCDAAFAAALTEAKMPHLLSAHLLYGAALRAMGRHSEAERQLSEARELAKRFGRTPYLNTMDDISDRIAATLRKGIPTKDAHGTRKDGPGRRPKSRR